MTSLQTADRSARRSTPRGRLLVLALAGLLAAAPGVPPAMAQGTAEDEGPTMSLSLREALEMAMDQNLDIAVQRYGVGISDEGIDLARGTLESTLTTSYQEAEINRQNVDPFAGLPVETSKSRGLRTEWVDPTSWGGTFDLWLQAGKQRSNQTLFDPVYSAAFNISYSQSLLRRLGVEVNEAPIRIAQNNLQISESQFRDTVQTTAEQTEFAYWNLVFARLDLRVQRQSLKLAEELLAMNKAKVEVGTMAPIDVTQAEAGVADRVEGVIVAEAGVKNAEDALRQLINPPAVSELWTSTIVPTDAPDFSPLQPDMEAAIESALEHRPDLQQQRVRVQSAALQESVDRKAKRWDLTVGADYATEGVEGKLIDPASGAVVLDTDLWDALGELSDTDFADWTLRGSLVIPLGNKDRKARYAQSMLRHQQAQMQMENLLLAAKIDVQTRVRNVTTNVKRVEAAVKNRELQQANVDAEQKKFENGMSTSFLVLQAQDSLRSAESRENLAIIEYNKSLVSLEKSKGTLLEARRIEVARSDRWAPDPADLTTDLRGIIGR